jgi:cathepsin L
MKVRFVLCVLALSLAIACAKKTQWFELENYTFEDYIQEHGKRYATPEEYKFREEIFIERMKMIMKHNSQDLSWKLGVNRFVDQTDAELRQVLGYKKGALPEEQKQPIKVSAAAPLPGNVDWRQRGVITAVKDQGRCGSCWTFGAAESVESFYALSTGQLFDLSEQQILDCTPNTNDCGGTGGCNGGTPELAFAQMIKMGGLSSEWTYPYISYPGTDYGCSTTGTKFNPVAVVTDYHVLESNDYNSVLSAVAQIGPLAINVDASTWHFYEYGVFNGCNQTNPDIDHVVQLVGYGTDPQYGGYWLVRNSWSPSWGEDGYIRLYRSSQTVCGTDTTPQDGTGCNGGPATVTVCGTCGILYDVSYPVIAA